MNRRSFATTIAVAGLLGFVAAPGVVRAGGADAKSNVTLIKNATILTITHGNIEHGSILIRDGKIAEVGADVKAPDGATVIDASGEYILPGIIDCHSHIAVSGNVNEGSLAVTSMVNIGDVLNSEDPAIYYDLAGGVTVANVLHGSANPIGGQTIVIKLRWGKPSSELPFEGALPGIKFALGENPKWSNYRPPPGYPRRDLKLDPLVEVLEGKRYIHCHSYRSDEILMLMRVSKEFGFKVRTFQHVLEGYKITDELAAYGVGASTFSDWWAYKMEAYDAIPYNSALMTERGVVVSVNSDDSEEARHLNQEAAKAIKYGGLSENDALKLVTLNPAIQLGIDNRVGSIDVGKDADLVIYNHDPLSVYAVAQKTLIDGTVYFDRDRDIAARPAREAEKKVLLEKEKNAREEEKKKAEEKRKTDEAKKKAEQEKATPPKDKGDDSGGAR